MKATLIFDASVLVGLDALLAEEGSVARKFPGVATIYEEIEISVIA